MQAVFIIIFGLWNAMSAAASERSVVYAVDASDSFAAVVVRYDRSSWLKGHDHVAQATKMSGRVRWTQGEPSRCDVEMTVPVAGLRIDPSNSRARVGLDGETKARTIAKIESNMWGEQVLNAVLFPAASFQSSACRANGDQVDVSGVLTVHGVGADVTVTMDIEADAKRFRGMGTLAVQHADFGMTPYSAPLGVLRNQAELVFHLDIVARSIDP